MTSTPMIEPVMPPRWAVVVQGIAGIVIGLLLVLAPEASAVVLVSLLGLYWLVGGIVALVSLTWDRAQWGWTVLGGIIGIIAGLAIIRHPLWSTVIVSGSLFVFFGFLGVAFGVASLVRAFTHRDWGLGLLGVVDIVIGLLLLFNPLSAVIALPILLGIIAIAGGVVALVVAFRMGREADRLESARGT
jgi:uncharacterized membrane protein HdeD (DUF308 family)